MGQKIKENDAKVEFFQVVFDVCFFFKEKAYCSLAKTKTSFSHS